LLEVEGKATTFRFVEPTPEPADPGPNARGRRGRAGRPGQGAAQGGAR